MLTAFRRITKHQIIRKQELTKRVRGGFTFAMSTNEKEDERRLYQCVSKYGRIVKQFDELIEMMNARTKPPKRRRGPGRSSNATTPASSSQPDNNELFVQTISRFLQELRTDSTTNPDCSTSTPNRE